MQLLNPRTLDNLHSSLGEAQRVQIRTLNWKVLESKELKGAKDSQRHKAPETQFSKRMVRRPAVRWYNLQCPEQCPETAE